MDTDGTQIVKTEETPPRPKLGAADTAAITTFPDPLSGFRNRLVLSPHVAWQNV